MKKLLIALSILGFHYSLTHAQTTKPDIVTTTGDYYSNAAGSLSWTLGEPVIETYSDGSNILTQGFQQSQYNITAVDNINQPTVKINVFPNPFTSSFTIGIDGNKELRAEVIELSGKVICEKNLTTTQTQITLNNLSNSIYLLKVYDTEGKAVQTFKIEKVK